MSGFIYFRKIYLKGLALCFGVEISHCMGERQEGRAGCMIDAFCNGLQIAGRPGRSEIELLKLLTLKHQQSGKQPFIALA